MQNKPEVRSHRAPRSRRARFPVLIWSNPQSSSIRPEKPLVRLAQTLIADYGAFAEIEAHERTVMLVHARCFRGAQRWATVRTLVRHIRAGQLMS